MSSTAATDIPISLLQTPEDVQDIGEDVDEDDVEGENLHLVSGSDDDVMKTINQQIGEAVSAKLGAIPADTSQQAMLDKLEKDKQEASQELQSHPIDADKAREKIREQL